MGTFEKLKQQSESKQRVLTCVYSGWHFFLRASYGKTQCVRAREREKMAEELGLPPASACSGGVTSTGGGGAAQWQL